MQMTSSGPCQNAAIPGMTLCRDHRCPFPDCAASKSSKAKACDDHSKGGAGGGGGEEKQQRFTLRLTKPLGMSIWSVLGVDGE